MPLRTVSVNVTANIVVLYLSASYMLGGGEMVRIPSQRAHTITYLDN